MERGIGMGIESSISLVEKKDANRVIHSNVEIKGGQYGVWTTKKDDTFFTPLGSAVYIVKIGIDIDTAEQTLYMRSLSVKGHDIFLKMGREDLTEQGVLNLVRYGIQVDKRSAPYLVSSIENQEPNAEICYYHHQLGFGKMKDGKTIFKGVEGMIYDGKKIKKVSEYNQFLEIRPCGDYNVWLQMVEEEVLGNPYLEVMIAAGVAGVLIDYLQEIVNVENLIIHNIGESSTGKTTAGMLMISCGSSPDLNGKGLAYNFADTQNALINSFHSSYPALIDEGSLVRYNPTNLLYNLSMGKEKKRMNKTLAVADTVSFHTAIVITSEKSLISMADENTGLLVRNVEFEGGQWTNSAESADRIKNTVKSNYGFLVPKMAEVILILDAENKAGELRKKYQNFCETLIHRAKERGVFNPLTERCAKHSAIILLSADMLKTYLKLNLSIESIMEVMEKHSLVENPDRADIGVRAMEYILQYVEGNRAKFFAPRNSEMDMRECWGKVMKTDTYYFNDGSYSKHSLHIGKLYFDRILKEGGFPESRVVLKRLRTLEILNSEKDRFLTKFTLSPEVGQIKGYILRLSEGQFKHSNDEPLFDNDDSKDGYFTEDIYFDDGTLMG